MLYASLLATHSVLFIERPSGLTHQGIAAGLGISAALFAIATILRMPMRDPDLPNDKISPAFAVPDPSMRSPEDNLTLWQFMSVSWMGPLISLGATRQLNDEDIWTPSYEFQHRKLHDAFCQLQGSVLRRLFTANGLDLVIISLLGVLELLASMVYSSYIF